MGVIKTSRSRLFNRVVRVDRMTQLSDGMGGMMESWSTLIDRYHVYIYPAEHGVVRQKETGLLAEVRRRALGDRAMNGRSIMIGDRFVDRSTNEYFKVLGVIRPQHGVAYRMTTYELAKMDDTTETAIDSSGS